MLLSELSYINYRHNRQVSPQVTVEEWSYIYGPIVWVWEERYQREVENAI